MAFRPIWFFKVQMIASMRCRSQFGNERQPDPPHTDLAVLVIDSHSNAAGWWA